MVTAAAQGLQHSWGPWLISAASIAWVSPRSFTVGLVSCLHYFFKSRASICIFLWEDQVLVAICSFKNPDPAALEGSSARKQRHGGEETNARARQFHSIQDALLHLLYFIFHF